MHGTNAYAPFAKTAVKDVDEEKNDLGPGIRINNDDDNGNDLFDRHESNSCSVNSRASISQDVSLETRDISYSQLPNHH